MDDKNNTMKELTVGDIIEIKNNVDKKSGTITPEGLSTLTAALGKLVETRDRLIACDKTIENGYLVESNNKK